MSMADNYEQRKVANTEINGANIDTCAIMDSTKPYETGISHPKFKGGNWIIVEEYNSKKEAQIGHDKWVEAFTDKLPDVLRDDCLINSCEEYSMKRNILFQIQM